MRVYIHTVMTVVRYYLQASLVPSRKNQRKIPLVTGHTILGTNTLLQNLIRMLIGVIETSRR